MLIFLFILFVFLGFTTMGIKEIPRAVKLLYIVVEVIIFLIILCFM